MKLPQSRKSLIWIGISILIFVVLMCIGTVVILMRVRTGSDQQLNFNTFASCDDVASRLSQVYSPYYGGNIDLPATDSSEGGKASSGDYSTTNVQVAGVDEPDILKTDGKYIYIAEGQSVFIVSAADTDLSNSPVKIALQKTATSLFINDDKLIIFSNSYDFYPLLEVGDSDVSIYQKTRPSNRTQVMVDIYDISDPVNPELARSVAFDGNLMTARMIDDIVYVVGNYYPNYYSQITGEEVPALIPTIADAQAGEEDGVGYVPMADCTSLSYYGDKGSNFTNIVAINLNEAEVSSKVLVGNSNIVYMSRNNLYLTTQSYQSDVTPTFICDPAHILFGVCPEQNPIDVSPDFAVDTAIFKINVDGMDIAFKAAGEVEGTLLNQFSMDEQAGNLRIATTLSTGSRAASSALYVLDENLQELGSVEELAQEESIYAVRFMGERAYVVTYQTVDPLFVFDLSNPRDPKVLGELKIPGFSNYLHPYDENHVIGFGVDTEVPGLPDGLKIALFDVEDPNNPIEVNHIGLGSIGSNSDALTDHKAVLFDREKNLLVIPAEIVGEAANPKDYIGVREFLGFIVFQIDLETGISEKARLSSEDPGALSNFLYQGRSFYIDNTLYTWGNNYLSSYNLSDFSELGQLLLLGYKYYEPLYYDSL